MSDLALAEAPGDAGLIRRAIWPDDLPIVRELFLEYAASLGFSLCFQGFDRELAGLPGAYAPPRGGLLLAGEKNDVGGVVALRPLDGDACEMKRLYVRPAWRGRGLGERLAKAILGEGAALGYRVMRLDTHLSMASAGKLYRGLGFVTIERYNDNRQPDMFFFERALE